MVVRIWRATASHEGASRYQQYFTASVLPHLKGIPGFCGASLLRLEATGNVELIALTTWSSVDDILAFTGADPAKAIVDIEAQVILNTFDTSASNYQVALNDGCLTIIGSRLTNS